MARVFKRFLTGVAGIACLLLASGCSLHGHAPRLDFAWRQGDVQLQAVPRTRTDAPSTSRVGLLWEDGVGLATPLRWDAPNAKDWREVRGTDKGPTIIGVGLSFDLSRHTWAARAGVVRRGSVNGLTPQLVLSFDDLARAPTE